MIRMDAGRVRIAGLHGRNIHERGNMKNFGRALRMSLTYRWSLFGSFVCCALVAILWGANLGAVYPFVEVVMRNRTLSQWVDERVDESETRIAEARASIVELESKLASSKKADANSIATDTQDTSPASIKTLISQKTFDIQAEQSKLGWTNWFGPTIKRWAPATPFSTLCLLMGLMFGGTVVRGLFLMGNMILVARVSQRTVLDLQNDVFGNVLDMEVTEMGVEGTGDLALRIRGETSTIGKAIAVLFGKTVREPMKMAACLIGAAIINWRLLILSVLICPIAGFLMVRLAKMTKAANRRAIEDSAKLLDRLYQALTYLRVVKAFSGEDRERQRFQSVARDVYKKGMRIALYNSLARINSELLGVGMISLSVLAGGYLAINHSRTLFGIPMADTPMDFGSVMAFFAFLIGIADPLRKMADVYNTLQGGAVAADRVFPLIDRTPAVRSPLVKQPIPAGQLSIEFNNVKFSYDANRPVLKGVSGKVPAGSSMAIIGHNGCGKSTLINLLPRFFDVEGGSMKVGGRDVRQFGVDELRQRIGYVTQQTMLFNDTIGENICYSNPDATMADIRDAARQAHAEEFIGELEHQYDTPIGEHGGKLSGGQRQRISLARAILKDPDILILDEATSQIDPESEQLIHQTLAEFMEGRTTVIITHRLATLDLVDRIMLMNDGQVVDCGTHEQLLARCPAYQRMRSLNLREVA